ncbi:hypothetical protein CLHUN_35070 [Ruminiclostridium hungatei]|uniref:Uncharacterized protein n=1 Tax=Ruminiclostridium hungatei TaxID=48256 RepID=A0A1V4SGU5_RUMHU|nr:hypothetical protein [Ruminiclostridium hungatei]OPX42685.1 hypothetical protein CLHUN_35070 [Ruminiclostridium hungatei]
MAEFCVCGSVKINGSCTNKNCSSNKVEKAAAKTNKTGRIRAAKPAAEEKPASKTTTKVPRASKCITYHISELPLKEQPK